MRQKRSRENSLLIWKSNKNKNKVVSYPTDIRYKHMQDYILVAFPILSATPTGTITIVVDGEGIVCSELRY